jgi:hypothetical protein
MSESNYKPDGTGVVMGDTKPMPDRGTSTGMTGFTTVTDGRSLDPDATNSLGRLSGTDSDPAAECYADDPTFGPAKGDRAEDAKESY